MSFNPKIISLTIFVFTFFSNTIQAETILEESSFSGYKQYTCGYVNKSWLPGVRSGFSFETFKEISARHRSYAAKNRKQPKVRAYYTRLAQRVEAKHRAAANGCKKKRPPLISSNSITLAKLPTLDKLVTENTTTAEFRPQAVIGTPPALTAIGSAGPKNVFWNPGVIDAIKNNTATGSQCSQFWGSTTEGASAGFGGCSMSQSVIQNLSDAINSGNTLCYMKNTATPAIFATGAIRVADGTLPAGGISNLFTAPNGSSSRVVGLRVAGEGEELVSFIRVYSSDELSAANNRYKYDFWSCENGSIDEIQQGTMTNAGDYNIHSYQSGSSNGEFNINAKVLVAADGSITFDRSRSRTLVATYTGSDNARKVSATIGGDNTISSKFFNTFASDTNYGVNIANFSGTNFYDLRFLSGAFKDRFYRGSTLQNSNLSGMEYRSSNYVSAPSLPELSAVSGVDLDTDPFFSSPSPVTLPSGFSCNPSISVGVVIDFSHPALASITETCEGGRVDNSGFCWEDADLASAQNAYHTSCP